MTSAIEGEADVLGACALRPLLTHFGYKAADSSALANTEHGQNARLALSVGAGQLKRMVADLSLDKDMLHDVIRRKL